MNNRFGLLAFVAILVTACASPDHELSIKPQNDNLPLVIVKAGGRSFNIPIVNGFHDLRTASSKAFDQLEQEWPSHRLLAVLVNKDDRARAREGEDLELEQLIGLYVPRKLEYSIIYEGKFEIIRRAFKENSESRLSKLLEVMEGELEEGMKTIKEDTGLVVQAEVTEPPVSLGIFLDSSDSIGDVYMTNLGFKSQDANDEVSDVRAMSIVRISDRILGISVSSVYENDETIDWCKQVSREWISSILAAN